MQAAVDRQADIRARLERVAQTLPPRGRVTPDAPPFTAPVHPDGTAHLETAASGCPALTTNPATNPAHIAAASSGPQDAAIVRAGLHEEETIHASKRSRSPHIRNRRIIHARKKV
jgi:hypothetical protein